MEHSVGLKILSAENFDALGMPDVPEAWTGSSSMPRSHSRASASSSPSGSSSFWRWRTGPATTVDRGTADRLPPVVAYADLTLLGGRHRQRDLDPGGLPDLHPIADRLVCATINDGTSGFPSVLRDCACGKQLWVSAAMLELVDARTIHVVCLGCHRTAALPMTLHPACMPTLHLMGRSFDALRCVAVLNGLGS